MLIANIDARCVAHTLRSMRQYTHANMPPNIIYALIPSGELVCEGLDIWRQTINVSSLLTQLFPSALPYTYIIPGDVYLFIIVCPVLVPPWSCDRYEGEQDI